MPQHPTIVGHLEGLSPQERAAAIAHWVYIKTSQRETDWDVRVPQAWSALDSPAREFNLESIETWAFEEGVLEAWVESVEAFRKERA